MAFLHTQGLVDTRRPAFQTFPFCVHFLIFLAHFACALRAADLFDLPQDASIFPGEQPPL